MTQEVVSSEVKTNLRRRAHLQASAPPVGSVQPMSTNDRQGDKPHDTAEQPSTTEHVDWDHVGFVTSSRYRVLVLQHLTDAPMTPTQISECHEVGISNFSRALRELAERDVVELLVPEERNKGRFYGLTERGEEIADVLPEGAA